MLVFTNFCCRKTYCGVDVENGRQAGSPSRHRTDSGKAVKDLLRNLNKVKRILRQIPVLMVGQNQAMLDHAAIHDKWKHISVRVVLEERLQPHLGAEKRSVIVGIQRHKELRGLCLQKNVRHNPRLQKALVDGAAQL